MCRRVFTRKRLIDTALRCSEWREPAKADPDKRKDLIQEIHLALISVPRPREQRVWRSIGTNRNGGSRLPVNRPGNY